MRFVFNVGPAPLDRQAEMDIFHFLKEDHISDFMLYFDTALAENRTCFIQKLRKWWDEGKVHRIHIWADGVSWGG